MKKIIFLPVIFILFLSGCMMEPKVTMTPLEIQSMQSRTFDKSKDIIFPSVMSVFQDLGYTINSADVNTGLITAESTAESNAAMKFWLGVAQVSQTKANAFIEKIGNKTSVRINFVNVVKQSSSWGQYDRKDNQILTPEPYRNAFEKIENAIFLRSGS